MDKEVVVVVAHSQNLAEQMRINGISPGAGEERTLKKDQQGPDVVFRVKSFYKENIHYEEDEEEEDKSGGILFTCVLLPAEHERWIGGPSCEQRPAGGAEEEE